MTLQFDTDLVDCAPDYLIVSSDNTVFTDDTRSVSMKARVPVTRANWKNLNKRVYSYKSLKSLTDDFRSTKRLTGKLGMSRGLERHPPKNPKYVKGGSEPYYLTQGIDEVYDILDVWMEGDIVWADVEFLDYQKGRQLASYLQNGGKLFVSIRAGGKCTGDDYLRYCDVKEWETFDLVKQPAYVYAQMQPLQDEFQNFLDNYSCDCEWKSLTDEELGKVKEILEFMAINSSPSNTDNMRLTDAFPPKKDAPPSEEEKASTSGTKPPVNPNTPPAKSGSADEGAPQNGKPPITPGQATSQEAGGNPNMPPKPDGSNSANGATPPTNPNDPSNPAGSMAQDPNRLGPSKMSIPTITPDQILNIIQSWPIETQMQLCEFLESSIASQSIRSMNIGGNMMATMMNDNSVNAYNKRLVDGLSDLESKVKLKTIDLSNKVESDQVKLILDAISRSQKGEKVNSFQKLLDSIKTFTDNKNGSSNPSDDPIINTPNNTDINGEDNMSTEQKRFTDEQMANLTKLADLAPGLAKLAEAVPAITGFLQKGEALEEKGKVAVFVDGLAKSTNPKVKIGEQEVDLTSYSEARLKVIFDKAKNKSSQKDAETYILDMFEAADQEFAYAKLNKKGFPVQSKSSNSNARVAPISPLVDGMAELGSFKGKTATKTASGAEPGEAPNTYLKTLEDLNDSCNNYRSRRGSKRAAIVEEFSKLKANKQFNDALMDERLHKFGWEQRLIDAQNYQNEEAFEDEVYTKQDIIRFMDESPMLLEASKFKNQAFISTLWQRQVFQQLEALQYFRGFGSEATTTEFGKVVRLPSITRPEPYTGQPDPDEGFYVTFNQDVSEMDLATSWQNFGCRYRQRANRLAEETIITMASGPLKMNVIAETQTQMMDQWAIVIDTNAYMEMFMAADEFNCVSVPGEVVQAAEKTYNAGGAGTVDGVVYPASVVYVAKLRCGESTGALTTNPYPIVRPRSVPDESTTGDETITIQNDITITGGTGGILRGKMSSTGAVIPRAGNATAAWAINFPKRHFIATAGAGFNATTHPTITYAYSTNWTTYDMGVAVGTEPEKHYTGFFHQTNGINQGVWQDRKVIMDTVLGTGTTIGTFLPMSDIFDNQRMPESTVLRKGYAVSHAMCEHADLVYCKVNGDLPDGDGSALMFAKDTNCYAVTSPTEFTGPIQALKANTSTGDITLLPQRKYSVRMMDIFATPTTRKKNSDGTYTVYNFGMKRIILKGAITYTRVAA